MKSVNLKIILFFLFFSILNAFDVEFTKVYKKYIVPNQEAVLIQTKNQNLTFPFKYIKTKKGYILIGNTNKINMWLDNEFYAPENAKFKTIKIAFVNYDKLQYIVINKIKHTYKTCNIKKVIFLNNDENSIILKPKTVILKYKILLDCK